MTLTSAGTITQSSGIITAGTLTGGSVGNATFGQTNAIANLGPFATSNGNLLLNDSIGLNITGVVNAGTGNLGLTVAGAITEQSGGVINAGILATQSTGGTSLSGQNRIGTLAASTNTGAGGFSLNNVAGLTVGGAVDAGTGDLALTTGSLIVNAGLQAGNNILATANGSQLLNDLLTAQRGGTSITNAGVVKSAQFAPNGSTGNAISFDTGTVNATGSVMLLLGDAGAMTGTVNVLGLGVSGQGGSADLHGSIVGDTTQAAAQQGFINPQTQTNYLFNGCPIGATTCGGPTPVPPPVPVPILPLLSDSVDILLARPAERDIEALEQHLRGGSAVRTIAPDQPGGGSRCLPVAATVCTGTGSRGAIAAALTAAMTPSAGSITCTSWPPGADSWMVFGTLMIKPLGVLDQPA